MKNSSIVFGVLISLFLAPNAFCEKLKKNTVDRNGYRYYKGAEDPTRNYEKPYYNNTGYFNSVSKTKGKKYYHEAYVNYNQGYYRNGYGNEYYHHGYFNNGNYLSGKCSKTISVKTPDGK